MQRRKLFACTVILAFLLLETTTAASYKATPDTMPTVAETARLYVKPSLYINPPNYFNIAVCASGIEDLYGYEFTMSYNTTVLNCIGVFVNTTGEGVSPQWDINDSTGTVWVKVVFESPAQPMNATSELLLVLLSFQMPLRGRSPLDLHDTSLLNADGQPVTHAAEDGLIIPYVPGDVDLDGHVGLSDIVCIAKAYHSKPGDSNWNPNADLNKDGKVSLIDIVICSLNFGKY